MAANAQRTPTACGRRSIASFLAQFWSKLDRPFHKPSAPSLHDTGSASSCTVLDAYSLLRAQRVWRYAMEDKNGGSWPDYIADRIAAEEQSLERRVFGPVSSLAGVVAQLELLVTYLDDSRWVDRTLMEHGLPAVRARRSELGAEARLAMEIAHRLAQLDQHRRGQ